MKIDETVAVCAVVIIALLWTYLAGFEQGQKAGSCGTPMPKVNKPQVEMIPNAHPKRRVEVMT